jgi:hypothetical protein
MYIQVTCVCDYGWPRRAPEPPRLRTGARCGSVVTALKTWQTVAEMTSSTTGLRHSHPDGLRPQESCLESIAYGAGGLRQGH